MVTALASDAQLLERVEGFCAVHGMAASTFGRTSIGDAALVSNMRAGRSLTLKTANRLVDFMATYRPTAEAA